MEAMNATNNQRGKKMTTITYRIVFADNTGSRAVQSLAVSCGGDWRDGVERFDGESDLAFIDCPAENAEFLEGMMDEDENVISYAER